ncbi:MAG: alpha/beta hydrolase, partial [Lachnospiraceae bacterium]|nr:alpha/beta hydrolase [Lachnospiraceae bacterium]
MASNQLFGTQIQTGELQKKIVEPEWKCPDGYSLSKIDMRHFGMEWFAPAEVGDQVVLQLHGGGYINRLRNIYRDFAVKYSGMAEGLPVLSVDYRVAPEHPYPAALLDAIEAYRWLLELGYSGEQIIVVGDSAGGGLALALSMWLRDQDMSLPGTLVLMSPWADLTASGKSYEVNYHQDPMF